MNFDDLMNTISSVALDARRPYHVTVGELIDQLKLADPESLIPLTNPHSYRGYYEDLALEPTDFPIKVSLLIEQLEAVLDTELTGYKGGEFLMTEDTPVWVSNYGTTGEALIFIDPVSLNILTK